MQYDIKHLSDTTEHIFHSVDHMMRAADLCFKSDNLADAVHLYKNVANILITLAFRQKVIIRDLRNPKPHKRKE